MADTVREKAMLALATALVGMPGFTAAQVKRIGTAGPSEPTFPLVHLFEGQDQQADSGDQTPHGKATHRLNLTIEGWISGPETPQTRLNNLLGDIVKILYTNYKCGGWAYNIHVLSSDSRVSQDEQFHSCFVQAVVVYRHALTDPFSL